MKIEIVTIGNEVLAGFTVNTNAAFIGQELFKLGLNVSRQTSLPDETEVLREGLSEALACNQLVITTGGLGPTLDDVTQDVAAELFDSPMRFDEEIAQELKKRYGDLPISLEDQATVPTKAMILKNSLGTAPGLVFHQQSTLICLPGVPAELRVMFSEQVIPFLKKYFVETIKDFRKTVHFFGLTESSVDPVLRDLQKKYPHITFGIYPAQGLLTVSLLCHSHSEREAEREFLQPIQELSRQFAEHIYESVSGKIEEAIHEHFIQKKLTLSIAESCTGGTVAARLTRLPNASHYFLGSVVAYSNQLKKDLLKIPEAILQEKGAVSEEVASLMAKSIQEITGSDFSLAVTGIAGPSGGTPEKPVGLVYCAIGRKGKPPLVWKIKAHGNRESIIDRSVNELLSALLKNSKV